MLTITSNSIDELNKTYRRLKDHYKAVDPIAMDQETLLYKVQLDKKPLSPVLVNLADKAIDMCDELHDLQGLNMLSFAKFIHLYKNKYIVLDQLNSYYLNMDNSSKMQLIEYIGNEISFDVLEGTDNEIKDHIISY